MRVHGIEVLAERKNAAPERGRSRLLLGGVLVALLALGGGYAYWVRNSPAQVSGEVPLAPLSRAELKGWLNHKNVDAFELTALFDLESDRARPLVEAARGKGTALEKAEAVVEAIRARAKAGAFTRWYLGSTREAPFATANEVAEIVAQDGKKAKLYPLEVAVLATAALRAIDVPAMVAEVYGFPGDRTPPDPTGHFGYFGIAVPVGSETNVLDPYTGRSQSPAPEDVRVLTDVEVLGAALNHRAIATMTVGKGDITRAFELSEKAVALDGRSPGIRSFRAVMLLQSAGVEEGQKELEAAAQLRPDAPRLKNLAALELAQGDVARASRSIAKALEQRPDFADGHSTLAMLHLAQGELDLARVALETAERLEHDVKTIPLLWAEYHLRTGDMSRALTRATIAVEKNPNDWQTRMQAARIFREGGRYDAMRKEARAILGLVPEARSAQVRELLLQVLGPTALDEPLDDDALAEGDLGTGSDDAVGAMRLGQGSRLLDDEPRPGAEGSPSLRLGANPPKLRLNEPSSGLELKLGD